MGRPRRIDVVGAQTHIVARRVDRRLLFKDDADYEHYIRLLAGAIPRFGWVCLAFCLMPNHVHLFIRAPQPELSAGMHRLHGHYTGYFNDRYDRVGRLFERRFRSKAVDDELYFVQVAGYIATNPVRAGLSATAEEWPWSSRALVANGLGADWLANQVLEQRLAEITGRTDFFSRIVL